MLREVWHDLVILRGGMGAKSRAAALAHLQPRRCECTGDVTGAKRRLYVIGNRDTWGNKPYFNVLAARIPAGYPASDVG